MSLAYVAALIALGREGVQRLGVRALVPEREAFGVDVAPEERQEHEDVVAVG